MAMTEKERNRARFPEIAAIKDEYGDDCTVVFIETPDFTLGKRPKDAYISPEFDSFVDNWYRLNGVGHEGSKSSAGRDDVKRRAGTAPKK